MQKQQLDVRSLKAVCSENIFHNIVEEMDSFETTVKILSISSRKKTEIEDGFLTANSRKIELLKAWKRFHGFDATYLELVEAFLRAEDRLTADCIVASVKQLRVHVQVASPKTTTPPRHSAKKGILQFMGAQY